MKLVESFLIIVYVIPEKVQDIVAVVTNTAELTYGDYKHVHWISSPGTEFFNVLESANKDVSESEVNFMQQ